MTDDAGCVSPASILIELGWPAKALSPNARVHHMEKWRYSKASKDTAFWATKAAMGRSEFPHDGEQRVAFVVTAYPPPDGQARDDDNLTAQIKPARDGIAKAIGVDDKFFDGRIQWGEAVPHGKLVIEVRA